MLQSVLEGRWRCVLACVPAPPLVFTELVFRFVATFCFCFYFFCWLTCSLSGGGDNGVHSCVYAILEPPHIKCLPWHCHIFFVFHQVKHTFFLILLFSSFSYLYLFIQGCADRCAEAERQRRARALLLQLTWSFYTWKYRINVSATKCWKKHFDES